MLQDKIVVITGAGSGIGAAMARLFAQQGARLILADINLDAAKIITQETGGTACACDVTRESDIQSLVQFTHDQYGHIDIFCSNAGLAFGEPTHSASATNEVWQTCWDIHVMSHVYAARAALPSMLERGEGHFINIASAAGLLSQIGDAAYSASKHAAVGFAESLAITHGSDGIKVSVVCPQYVATPLIGHTDDSQERGEGVITAEEVAESVLSGIREDRFLILPHKEVHEYMQLKAGDTDKWISGMQRLREKIITAVGSTKLEAMHKLFQRK